MEAGRIPDMSGKVMTVRGPVDPDGLGITLAHEHLFVDLRKNHLPHTIRVPLDGRAEPIITTQDFPATELAVWEAKVDLGTLDIARQTGPIADNYVLADEQLAIDEAMAFKNAGGGTLVEVTSIGIKRAPEAMRRVAEATGLNIIMGTGFYTTVFHPDDMDSRSVEGLTEEIVGDVTQGVGDTGIRAGIIGEIGVNGDPITANEIKSLRAAARASRLTGGAITLHCGGAGAERQQTLDILEQEGADPTRVIFGHADQINEDMDLMLELLERGAYLEFDLLGRDGVLEKSVTLKDAEAIVQLTGTGHAHRILLSHDVCWKVHLKRYGGFGYAFILETFLPHLRTIGVSDADIDQMMVTNPKTVLPFTAPGTQ